jgi:hypothetical protein
MYGEFGEMSEVAVVDYFMYYTRMCLEGGGLRKITKDGSKHSVSDGIRTGYNIPNISQTC